MILSGSNELHTSIVRSISQDSDCCVTIQAVLSISLEALLSYFSASALPSTDWAALFTNVAGSNCAQIEILSFRTRQLLVVGKKGGCSM